MISIKNWLIALFISLLIGGCSLFSSRFRSSDPFYRSTGDFDFLRIPLIKPYDAIKGNEKTGWTIDLRVSPFERETYYITIKGVEKIAVHEDVVFVYTLYKEESAEGLNQNVLYWFVLDAGNSIEKGFENEDDFLEYIQKYKTGELVWMNPDEVFTEFEKTGCLNWIPDCEPK